MCGGTNDRATLTSDAGVGGLEVRHQFLGARVIGVQRGVRNTGGSTDVTARVHSVESNTPRAAPM